MTGGNMTTTSMDDFPVVNTQSRNIDFSDEPGNHRNENYQSIYST